MAGWSDYLATGGQHPGLPEQPSAAFCKAALRLSLVVAPSILIDDLELHPVEEELPKLPVVPAPDMTR